MLAGAPNTRLGFRLTRHNRSSVAAVLAVLETNLRDDMPDVLLTDDLTELSSCGLVCYSFMTQRVAEVTSELQVLTRAGCKGARPALAAGGPHPSGSPEDTLAMGFDWALPGEAGDGTVALVRAFLKGSPPPTGVLEAGPPPALDACPPWPPSNRLFAPLELTRGCPLACAYCQTPALHGRTPRHRGPEEIEELARRGAATGHSYMRFISPNSFAYGSSDGRTPNVKALDDLLERVARQGFERIYLGNFPSEVRPDSVTKDMLAVVRAHCSNKTIVVGAQSGSPRMLSFLSRGHTVAQALNAIELIANAGFIPRVDFIFGLPGETGEDRRLSVDLMRHLVRTFNAHINSHVFKPLPGTPLASSPPGTIDDETRATVAELVGRGKASGHVLDPDSGRCWC